MDLKRLIVFCILMENGEGIMGKSPEYVESKFHSIRTRPYPDHMLDQDNAMKYERYLKNWLESIEPPISKKVKINGI
ncbi:hypothetical protein ES702_01819 [subsurface metagenome]